MSVMYHMALPPQLLKRDFWLYIWKIGLPNGRHTHYVGMTGDVTGAVASAFGRVTAHFGKNNFSNALRKNLRRRAGVDVEDCLSLDFFAYGPVYPLPENPDDYESIKSIRPWVAALEKHLWYQMHRARYDMLNKQPGATALLNPGTWKCVCSAFQQHFPNLQQR